MKLIHKTTRYYLIYALFIFGVGTVLFYYVIKIILLDGIDEAIHQEKLQLIENLNYENFIDELRPSENIDIKHSTAKKVSPDSYSTVLVFDSVQNELVDYRQLKATYKFNDNLYEIRIRQSMQEAEALLNGILPAEIGLFVLFLIGVLLMNNYVNRSVWEPFYDLLEKIKAYDFEKTKVIQYTSSDTKEFQELGKSIEKMTNKIYRDFLNQKEFNENSSHELQTPLAIIRNKLELLIQSKNLKEEEMEIIESIFDAVKRLNLLNKGLILISQIDNHQYSETEEVYMDRVVNNNIKHFMYQIEERNITLTTNIEEKCKVRTNPILSEILVTNIVSNAIKHNLENGSLRIELNRFHLLIENSGKPLSAEAENMFERFKKDSDSELSIGLGLAIVKKICVLLGHKIVYTNTKELHTIEIFF
ncbi:MAG TPA: HAMP domain-containing sensor histidine kinase [Cytophagaceae bacterium]|jgi:signal transduction histidine kinase|nr:HAMP domain-containing sensor histidine kinase [Cytophagaceae bacterium]